MAKAPTSITWIVRFVEKGVLQVRAFQTERAAQLFMQRTVDAGGEVRSWAEVRTHEREVPTLPGQP
jgi:hypothetical protein